MSSTRPPLFLIYLLLRIPAKQRVSLSQDGRRGVGMIDQRSRSLAVISLRSLWNSGTEAREARPRWRLDGYGNDTAAIQLDRLASEWQELRREHHTRLEVTARGHADALRLSFAWSRT